jgi:hypothetical protein
MTAKTSRYGLHSRRMLTFLNKNPGATSSDISSHLFNGKEIEIIKIEYTGRNGKCWREVHSGSLEWYQRSESYSDIKILGRRTVPLSSRSRGKFAYLLSPYCSRTLSADTTGSRPHPGAANRKGQRMWFYRSRVKNGRYLYFLTLKGLAALKEHGA